MSTKTPSGPKISAPPRPGIYSRGTDTVDAILKAALDVLVEEGSAAFTLRRIATRCGIQVGNVSRHFPRKEMLVQVLLEQLLSPNEGEVRSKIIDAKMPADQALSLVIGGSLDEIKTKKMARLFTELWAMSNQNEFIAERIELVYRFVHRLISSFVAELNPSLSPEETEVVAVYISSFVEGTTVLAGFGRPWNRMMPQLKGIATKFLVEMAKTITPDEVNCLDLASANNIDLLKRVPGSKKRIRKQIHDRSSAAAALLP